MSNRMGTTIETLCKEMELERERQSADEREMTLKSLHKDLSIIAFATTLIIVNIFI